MKQPGKIYIWGGWILILAVYVLLRANLLDIPLDRDEGNFGYTGQVILDGGIPYRDVYDHKPPVTSYLYAIALLFVPPTPAGIHIFLHVYTFLTLIGVFLLGAIYADDYETGLWSALIFAVFSSLPSIQGFTASSEMFMLLPTVLSLLCAVLALRKDGIPLLLLSGVLAAVACWTKQSGIFMSTFIALYVGVSYLGRCLRGRQPYRRLVAALSVWVAGFVGVSLLITLYYVHKGVLDEFIYWTFIHGYYYSKAVSPKLSLVGVRLAEVFRGNWALEILILVFLAYGLYEKKASAWFALILLAFSVASTIPGYAYPHYFAQLAPAAAVAGGLAVAFMAEKTKQRCHQGTFILIAALLLAGLPVSTQADYYFNRSGNAFAHQYFGENPFPESLKIADYIAKKSDKDATVFIAGSEPQILLYSRRKSATAYVMVYPLMWSFPRYMEFQQRAWNQIKTSVPEFIVFVDLQTSQLWDGKAKLWWYQMVDREISTHYHLSAIMTVATPVGRLMSRTDTAGLAEVVKKKRFPIYIYRRGKQPE